MQRPSTHSAAPFTRSLWPCSGFPAAPLRVWMPELAAGAASGAEQITLMDFLFLSNSRVARDLFLRTLAEIFVMYFVYLLTPEFA